MNLADTWRVVSSERGREPFCAFAGDPCDESCDELLELRCALGVSVVFWVEGLGLEVQSLGFRVQS